VSYDDYTPPYSNTSYGDRIKAMRSGEELSRLIAERDQLRADLDVANKKLEAFALYPSERETWLERMAADEADLARCQAALEAQIEHTRRFDVLVVAVDHFLNIDVEGDDCPFRCDYDPDSVTPAEGHPDYCPVRKLSDAFQDIPESYIAARAATTEKGEGR